MDDFLTGDLPTTSIWIKWVNTCNAFRTVAGVDSTIKVFLPLFLLLMLGWRRAKNESKQTYLLGSYFWSPYWGLNQGGGCEIGGKWDVCKKMEVRGTINRTFWWQRKERNEGPLGFCHKQSDATLIKLKRMAEETSLGEKVVSFHSVEFEMPIRYLNGSVKYVVILIAQWGNWVSLTMRKLKFRRTESSAQCWTAVERESGTWDSG